MHGLISGLFALVAVTAACTIPSTPLSNTITQPFAVQVQNASYPKVHNFYMNLLPSGGGDQHLFIGPVGNPTNNLVLIQGVISRGIIHAVINGEFSTIDDTTKMFMTDRSDPKAIFAPTYACNPDNNALQVELRLVGRQFDPPGGWICLRPSYDNSYEFRYYPPGNTKIDPARTCIKVRLVMRPANSIASSTSTRTTSTSTTKTSTTFTTSTTSTRASTSTATSVKTPLPYTDMTAHGFAFIGCAPEEKTVQPPDGAFRTLPVLYATDSMTDELCMNYCASHGYAFAGTEYRRECWCGQSYAATRQPGTTLASLAGCSMTCMGNTSEICGGAAWLSLYRRCTPGSLCVNAKFT